jgi:hypothetical protein
MRCLLVCRVVLWSTIKEENDNEWLQDAVKNYIQFFDEIPDSDFKKCVGGHFISLWADQYDSFFSLVTANDVFFFFRFYRGLRFPTGLFLSIVVTYKMP